MSTLPVPSASSPSPPVDLVGEAVDPNTIEVRWMSSMGREEDILSYELYFNDGRRNARVSINPPVNNYRLTGLISDRTYEIQVGVCVLYLHNTCNQIFGINKCNQMFGHEYKNKPCKVKSDLIRLNLCSEMDALLSVCFFTVY